MSSDFEGSQLNRFPKIPANFPDAFEKEPSDQKSIMMSLWRFNRNGAKDCDIQMNQTVQLNAASHTWKFYRSITKYGPSGPTEEFTIELQEDKIMKQSITWFINVDAIVMFMLKNSCEEQNGTGFVKRCNYVFRHDKSKLTIDIPRKNFNNFSKLEDDKDNQVTVTVKLTVASSSGFRNRRHISYDFSARSDNSDLKLVFFGEECVYVNSGYLAQLSSYFAALRRRFSELPKDECGLPFETFLDIERDEFVTLLGAVYPSKENIDDHNVPFLLPLADRFLFEGLMGEIEKYLMSSKIGLIDQIEWAHTYNMAELQSNIFSKLDRNKILQLKKCKSYSTLSTEVKLFLFEKLMEEEVKSQSLMSRDWSDDDDSFGIFG